MVKNLPTSSGDVRVLGSTHGLGRSPGGGNSSPLRMLARRIPWPEEPGELWSLRLKQLRTTHLGG